MKTLKNRDDIIDTKDNWHTDYIAKKMAFDWEFGPAPKTFSDHVEMFFNMITNLESDLCPISMISVEFLTASIRKHKSSRDFIIFSRFRFPATFQ